MGVRSRRDNDGEIITVTRNGGWYVAKDDATGVASQGKTKIEALENLAEALELHTRPEPADSDEDVSESTAPWFYPVSTFTAVREAFSDIPKNR